MLLLFVLAATGLAFLPHLWAPLTQPGGDPLLTAAREERSVAPPRPQPAASERPSAAPQSPRAGSEAVPASEPERLAAPGPTPETPLQPTAEPLAPPGPAAGPFAAPSAEELAGEAPAVGPVEEPPSAEVVAEAVEEVPGEGAVVEEIEEPVAEEAVAAAGEVDPFEPPLLDLRPPPGDGEALRPLVSLQQLAERVLGDEEAEAAPAAGQAERVPPAWSGSGGPWQSEAAPGGSAPAGGAVGPRRGLVIDAGPPPRPGEVDLRAAQQAMAQGAFAAAVPHYEQALRRLPGDSQVEIGLAVALQKSGRVDEALAVYNRLLLRDPDNLAALTNFFGLVGSRSPALAIEEMQRLLQRNPQQPTILAQLGLIYANSGDRANGLRYLEEAVRLAPDDPVFAMNLAVLNDQLGRREEAIQNYRQVLRLSESGAAGEIPVASVRERLRYLYGN